MTMRDIAIVGRNNRYGLTRDAEILRQGLVTIGVQVALFDRRKRSLMDRLRRRKVAGMVVYLERIHPAWLGARSRCALISSSRGCINRTLPPYRNSMNRRELKAAVMLSDSQNVVTCR